MLLPISGAGGVSFHSTKAAFTLCIREEKIPQFQLPSWLGFREALRMSAPWWDSDWKDRSGPEYRCYVSNLPYSANESSLKDAFASYGAVSSEVVVDRETGRSRGFGFVQFEDQKSMNDAIQGMNGQQVGDRNVNVSQANQRSRRWRA
ncbi:unnamed protein product [Urochloa humidicola]